MNDPHRPVLTDAPLDVARVARRVEELVAKYPRGCTKAEISAALPQSDHRHLAAAYRHLQACNRLNMTGQRLTLHSRSTP